MCQDYLGRGLNWLNTALQYNHGSQFSGYHGKPGIIMIFVFIAGNHGISWYFFVNSKIIVSSRGNWFLKFSENLNSWISVQFFSISIMVFLLSCTGIIMVYHGICFQQCTENHDNDIYT